MLEVNILNALDDNFIYILRDPKNKLTAVIDPSESEPVLSFLKEKNWHLDFIFNTHHHFDHVDGNSDLVAKYKCPAYCSTHDLNRIPKANFPVSEGDSIIFGDSKIEVLETPGHTLGAVCYHIPKENILFTGDTLFSCGCGRLFEGSFEQMHNSLQKLKNLPNETKVYCGHEYTEANLKFTAFVEPNLPELSNFTANIASLRKEQNPSVPSTLEKEKKFNVFLTPDLSKFTEYRKAKDNF